MPGYLSLARTTRNASTRIRTARHLHARWQDLDSAAKEHAQPEVDRLKAALVAVRERMESGPRGFAREFSAALKREDAAPAADPRPLGELVRELHAASTALRDKLNASA